MIIDKLVHFFKNAVEHWKYYNKTYTNKSNFGIK